MRIDIKRLHKVHKNYPNNYRREGKTTYCLDSLLRAAQTGYYKHLCYVTNTEKAANIAFNQFHDLLHFLKEEHKVDKYNNRIVLGEVIIKFSTNWKEEIEFHKRFDGYIVDYFVEENKLWYDIKPEPLRIIRKLPYYVGKNI